MANITTPVTSKPIASTVENDAYLLGIQKDGDNNLALFRMRLGEIRANTVNDTFFVPMLIEDYGAREAFRIFVAAYAEQSSNLTAIVSRFYAAAAKSVNETYTSTFYKFATSNTSDGTKIDDNAQLVCTASTNATAGQDDYANLPLFMCFDCNYTIDSETLEPVIIAIKGVTGTYNAAPTDSFVGVLQMTGWVHRTTDETTKTVSYKAQQTVDYKPLPEAVRASDNSVRPFVIHAKYAAGYNSAGKLSSVSGIQPATLRSGSDGSTIISYSGQIALWRQWGNQYGGSCLCDLAFLQLMLEIKYATLGSAKVLSGCRSYDINYSATVSEENVTRIIISKTSAANLVVGSRVSLGVVAARASSSCYNICDISTIESITDYDENNSVITLDTETPFSVTAGTTKIITQPWTTGSTDNVLGNDGSPSNNTNGKEPYKLQGIELQLGMYESLGDTTLYANGENAYVVYTNRLAANRVSSGNGTDAEQVGTIPNTLTTAAWSYNAEFNWAEDNQESYMLAQVFGGSSSAGYRSSTYREAATNTGWRQWLAFGILNYGAICGLAAVDLVNGLGAASWIISARASGTGGNRGEYMAA